MKRASLTERNSLKRLLLHFPVGVVNAVLFYLSSAFGFAFLLMFIIYQLNADWHIQDRAYLDIAGWLWGFSFAGFVWLALRFWL